MIRELLHISTTLRAFPFQHPVLSVLCKLYTDVEWINTIPYHTCDVSCRASCIVRRLIDGCRDQWGAAIVCCRFWCSAHALLNSKHVTTGNDHVPLHINQGVASSSDHVTITYERAEIMTIQQVASVESANVLVINYQHSGILQPFRWAWDYTLNSNAGVETLSLSGSSITSSYTTKHLHSGERGTTLYTATLEWKPRACQDHPLHLAAQPNTNIPVSVGLHFTGNTGVETPSLPGSSITSSYTTKHQLSSRRGTTLYTATLE